MFESWYKLLDKDVVVCDVIQTATSFPKESNLTDYLGKVTRKAGWKYLRVDTVNQMGFPDILLLKGSDYWQIEAKILRKKKLVSLEDDLKWQFGQIGYFKRALSLNLNYMLVVAKGNNIAYIKGENNVQQCFNYTNVTKLI